MPVTSAYLSLAPAASRAGLGTHLLGSLGASGAALVFTLILITGVRGRHKLKFDHHAAAVCGLIAGTLYASAVGVWSTPASITTSLASATQGSVGGTVGTGALAMAIVVVLYGVKLKPGKAAFLGIAAATIFPLAGGIWGLAATAVASLINNLLGVS
jgi:hypothetical protein